MSIQYATAIVQRLGPCRIAIDTAAHADLARELALIGCDVRDATGKGAAEGATVGFVEWPRAGGPATLADAIRPFRGMATLMLQSEGQARDPIFGRQRFLLASATAYGPRQISSRIQGRRLV